MYLLSCETSLIAPKLSVCIHPRPTLQKHARRFLVRSRFLRVKRGVIRLQALVRGVLLRMRLRRWHASATTIQRRYRGYRRARKQHLQFINTRKAVLLIQNEWREWKRRQGVEYNW